MTDSQPPVTPIEYARTLPPFCRTAFDAGRRFAMHQRLESVPAKAMHFDATKITPGEREAFFQLGIIHFAHHWAEGITMQVLA